MRTSFPTKRRRSREDDEELLCTGEAAVDVDEESFRASLHACRLAGQFIDVVVVVGTERFPCHRMVLAAGSRFFRTLFNARMRDSTSFELPVADVCADAFHHVLEYLYTGSCRFPGTCIGRVLDAASRLDIASLQRTCISLFAGRMSPSCALDAWELANAGGLGELRSSIKHMVCARFLDVVAMDRFRESMPGGLLLEVLADDRLEAPEDVVLNALLSWASLPGREETLLAALQLVRFPLVAPAALYRVEQDPVLQKAGVKEAVSALLLEAYRFHALPSCARASDLTSPRTRRRGHFLRLCALARPSAESNRTCLLRLDMAHRAWKCLPEPKVVRTMYSIAAADHRLYALGGVLEGETTSNGWSSAVECLTEETMDWERMPSMLHARVGAAYCEHEGTIVVCGGFDGCQVLASCERFLVAEQRWEPLPPLPSPRVRSAATSMGGHLYVLGGWTGKEPMSDVVRFNSTDGTWEQCPALSSPRSTLAAVAFEGHVYAIGGLTKERVMVPTVERLGPSKERWEPVESLSHLACGQVAAVLHGKIHVCGGTKLESFGEDGWADIDASPTAVVTAVAVC